MLIGLEEAYAGRCLLAAEDNEINRIVLEHMLADCGLPFHIAHDGEAAVAGFVVLRPIAVLLDVSMPVMNGYEAAAAMRAHELEHSLLRTPIIAMTAHALKGDREKCLAAGMDDYLAKPLGPDALSAKVALWTRDRIDRALAG
jgi:CheY-like chemotaxis protein